MDRPYVEWVRVENYRCIKSADLHLTPLHALIGPNDSGKSSILRAIQQGPTRAWLSNGLGVGSVPPQQSRAGYPGWNPATLSAPDAQSLDRAYSRRQVLRLDPDDLRKEHELIQRGHSLWFRSERGRGLPALYDALLARNRDGFASIDAAFKQLFPTAAFLRLDNPSTTTKSIGLTLAGGQEIGAAEMSEGMLYWLAFAIIEHLSPQAMLLIEEPENGLHPARIAEVMRILREVSQRTQIILATHSPLVINELQPDEVTLVTRTAERGTICTPMKDTRDFATREKIYALGELWLSFADGKLEEDLVPESARQPIKE